MDEVFKTDIYIPSISIDTDNNQIVNYTWVSKELANEAVASGIMNAPEYLNGDRSSTVNVVVPHSSQIKTNNNTDE